MGVSVGLGALAYRSFEMPAQNWVRARLLARAPMRTAGAPRLRD
ncbi:hypothetical protein [Pseudorhodoferax sp. Leaf267]|nr:hypothetical protein [Pseudorhodoferax sp. Leaf267]